MPRGRPGQVGNLARHVDAGETVLQHPFDLLGQFADAEDFDTVRAAGTAHRLAPPPRNIKGSPPQSRTPTSTIGSPCSSCKCKSTSVARKDSQFCHSDSSRIQYTSSDDEGN